MKERSSFGRGGAVVFLLAFVAFLGFKMYDGLTEKITTMDATLVTVEDLLSVDGTFIRDQIVVVGNDKDAEYMVENGEKVSVGQGLVISFDNEEAAESYVQLKAINDDIDALTYINSITSTSTDGIKLDNLVYTQVDSLISDLNRGQINKIGKEYATLKQLVVARDSGLYNQASFAEKIDALKNEAKQHSNIVDSASDTFLSSYSGYFIYNADGYESIFNKSCLNELSVDSLINGRNMASNIPDNSIGALVNDFYWYVAFSVTGEQASILKQMDQVSAYIPNISLKDVQFTVDRVLSENTNTAIVVLKCHVMNEDYLNTRFQTIDLIMGSYEGIKVPINALHQENGKWGVYCLEGATIKFKPVKIIYQTDSFYLLEMAESSSKGIYIYDKIVIGGKD